MTSAGAFAALLWPGFHTDKTRPRASWVASVRNPLASLLATVMPETGSRYLVDVNLGAPATALTGGVVVSTWVTGPPSAGVYDVVLVKPSASVALTARPYLS